MIRDDSWQRKVQDNFKGVHSSISGFCDRHGSDAMTLLSLCKVELRNQNIFLGVDKVTLNQAEKLKFASVFSLFVIAVTTTGCDSVGLARSSLATADFTGTSTVSGTVTMDGKPLDETKLVFVPEKLLDGFQKFRPLAYGTTDSSGSYSLALGNGSKDIPNGRYRVLISKRGLEIAQHPQIVDQQVGALLNRFTFGETSTPGAENGRGSESLSSPKFADIETAGRLADLSGKIGLYEVLPPKCNRDSELTATVDGSGSETKIDFSLSFDGE